MTICGDHFLWATSTNEEEPLLITEEEKKRKPKQVNNDKTIGRYYELEDHKLFSITNVLGDDPKKKKVLHEWRKRVGTAEANRVSRFAASRGTNVHNLFEKYIRGKEEIDTSSLMPHVLQTFMGAKDALDSNLTKVYYLEERLYSLNLGIAGTVDGIVEWNGINTILDFKTSRKLKKKEYIDSYFMQTAAYSLMLEEMTNGKASFEQLCVFIANDEEPESPQIFLEHRDNWIPLLLKNIHDFYVRRDLTLPPIFRSNKKQQKQQKTS